jgi:hypothetical protein
MGGLLPLGPDPLSTGPTAWDPTLNMLQRQAYRWPNALKEPSVPHKPDFGKRAPAAPHLARLKLEYVQILNRDRRTHEPPARLGSEQACAASIPLNDYFVASTGCVVTAGRVAGDPPGPAVAGPIVGSGTARFRWSGGFGVNERSRIGPPISVLVRVGTFSNETPRM